MASRKVKTLKIVLQKCLETSPRNIHDGVLSKYSCRPSWRFQRAVLGSSYVENMSAPASARKNAKTDITSRIFQNLKYTQSWRLYIKIGIYWETQLHNSSCMFSEIFKTPLRTLVWSLFLVALQPLNCQPATPVKKKFLKIFKTPFQNYRCMW